MKGTTENWLKKKYRKLAGKITKKDILSIFPLQKDQKSISFYFPSIALIIAEQPTTIR
jgi:hypothetical protein